MGKNEKDGNSIFKIIKYIILGIIILIGLFYLWLALTK